MDHTLLAKTLDLAIAIQQIPAPTSHESQRSAYLHDQFQLMGLLDVSMDSLGNVFGRVPGQGNNFPLIVSAHLDTVFPPGTDLRIKKEFGRIYGPGIGDNSLGVAGLFGLFWALQGKEIELPGDLWLVANVGEEGLGNLIGMRAVVERFGNKVSAYIILEGMALGQVYHRGLGVQRYRITITTSGGHSWVDYGKPSAIHQLAALVTGLTHIRIPSTPRTSLNVGVISGGTSINTIAPEAHLELDLRSESSRVLSNLVSRIDHLAASFRTQEVQVAVDLIGQRPAGKIPSDHPLVTLACRCLQNEGLQPHLSIGSTDANIPLSLGIPAVCIGLSTGQGAHTVQEYINIDPLSTGLDQLVHLVEGSYKI